MFQHKMMYAVQFLNRGTAVKLVFPRQVSCDCSTIVAVTACIIFSAVGIGQMQNGSQTERDSRTYRLSACVCQDIPLQGYSTNRVSATASARNQTCAVFAHAIIPQDAVKKGSLSYKEYRSKSSKTILGDKTLHVS